LDVNTFLEDLLDLFDGVTHAVLGEEGIEDFHSFRVTSTIQLVFLLCSVGERGEG